MAREYMITTTFDGTDLQITEEGQPEQHFDLPGASDETKIRKAEEIINQHFYGVEPFPGFHWQPLNPNGWRTTDDDLKPI